MTAVEAPRCAHEAVTRGVYEYCEDCGAVRHSRQPGRPEEPWHSCPLCSTELPTVEGIAVGLEMLAQMPPGSTVVISEAE